MKVKSILLEDIYSVLGERQVYLVNRAALDKAEQLRKETMGLRCAAHPEFISVLIVQTMPSGMLSLDRSGMCCDELAKDLQL